VSEWESDSSIALFGLISLGGPVLPALLVCLICHCHLSLTGGDAVSK
jgi:hypothetical protein